MTTAVTSESTDPGPITMYGADWCGDCRRAKAWFADHEIDYTYIDLIKNPDETETVLERNNGKKSIPVVVFSDDSHLTEPSNADLDAKVAELSTRSAAGSTAPTGRIIIDNTDQSRFELRDGSGDSAAVLSFADYTVRGPSLIVPHVETDPAHRGNGFAAELMGGIVVNLRVTERKITPLCPYAAGYLRDRPETHDLLT